MDIEGQQREVRDAIVQHGDAQGRVVMRYDYDMLGNRIHQASMEAGERWMLNEVGGKTLRLWDSRGHNFRYEYDPMRRPLRLFVRGTAANHSDPRTLNRDLLLEQYEDGEGQVNDTALNLRTQIFRHYDSAGVVTNLGHSPLTNQDEAYDFKGNLLCSTRRLAQDYHTIPDWSGAVALEAEAFHTSTTYDALNRPVTLHAPDHSTIRSAYNAANLLERVEVNGGGAQTDGQPVWTPFVSHIDYNARGQRTAIAYGNGTVTAYAYDLLTFRLIHLTTRRNSTVFPGDCPQPPRTAGPAATRRICTTPTTRRATSPTSATRPSRPCFPRQPGRTERRLYLRRYLPLDRSHGSRASGAGRGRAHSALLRRRPPRGSAAPRRRRRHGQVYRALRLRCRRQFAGNAASWLRPDEPWLDAHVHL